MPERPPPAVFWFALACAAAGLTLNWLGYREPETLVLGVIVAVPVLGAFAWAVWGQ
ncbi:hypothetical protein L1280_002769 [Deinococcus sp. HSC-46F16]|uniref:hypothetical protein n=1 Tax=Deinococcus sp. HSC-46F16 TaxID=2910968 RepID=UPI00209DD461|nr:hypothetical protein [Deinococcus sp. HSC-46F16]MCP2015601.1 hypothetical protein [Deinococcus sp. HSC-46F16]